MQELAELCRGLMGGAGRIWLWIDDLQWSDRESAGLFVHLLASGLPITVIGCVRGGRERPGPLLEALAADGRVELSPVHWHELGPLGTEESRGLALSLLPNRHEGRELASTEVAREGGGHPLFISELALNVVDGGASQSGDALALSSLIARRIAGLAPKTRALLEVTALAGAPLARQPLREAVGLGAFEAELAVDQLRARRLVVSRGLEDDARVEVHHARISDAVVHALDAGRVRDLHGALANVLLERADASAELRARHLSGAERFEEAGPYWIFAARQSADALAFEHAAEAFRSGLAQAKLGADEVVGVRLELAQALANMGDGAAAAREFTRVADARSGHEALDLRRRAGEQLLKSGHLERGLDVFEEALSRGRIPRTAPGLGRLIGLQLGRVRSRLQGLGHQRRHARELEREQLVRLDALRSCAESLGAIDPFLGLVGLEFQADHLRLALELGEPRRLLFALTLELPYVTTPGRGVNRRTRQVLDLASALADSVDDPEGRALFQMCQGLTAYLCGDLDQALLELERAQQMFDELRHGLVWPTTTIQRFIIAACYYVGRFDTLAGLVPDSLASAEGKNNYYATLISRAGYGTCSWLAQDQFELARAHLTRARAEWRVSRFRSPEFNLLIGEYFLDLYAGEGLRMHERIEATWPEIAASRVGLIGVVRIQLLQLRSTGSALAAHHLRCRGRESEARKLLSAARAQVARMARDTIARAGPLARLVSALIAVVEGARERAARELELAASECDGLGLVGFSAAARWRWAECRGDEAARACAEQCLLELGVVRPGAMVCLLVPWVAD